MTHVLELLRAVNCPLLSVTLMWLTIRCIDILPALSRGWRLVFTGIGLYLLAGVAGSAIKYVKHVPVDVSIAIATTSALLILVGLWVSRGDRWLQITAHP